VTNTRRVVIFGSAAVLALAAWYELQGHATPAGQAPLAEMNVDTFRAEFNGASDQTRVIILLSPT
jgi:hypothetical protein